MPTWLAKSINGRLNVSYDYAKQVINYKAKSGRLVSAKYIRKWFNNFLVRQKVEKDVRNFILGRIGEIKKSVEGDYYLELLQHADRDYPRAMKKFPIRIKENLTHNVDSRESMAGTCNSRNVKNRKS
ncbi:integrase [Archaeoglobus sp.]